MIEPKISVIIPVYNVEPYIRQCLDSVINQTYKHLEIIIIDDGSPDNCGSICDQYASKDERIKVIHKENEGLCAARNDGIKRAEGEWIAFVDSDDWCELNYYEKMLSGLGSEEPDILFASGRIVEYSRHKQMVYTVPSSFRCTEKKDMHRLIAGLLAGSIEAFYGRRSKKPAGIGAPWDKLYNAKFIKNNDLYFDTSQNAWEDLLFNFQAFNKAKLVKGCTCIGYHYRQIGTSIIYRFNPDKPNNNYSFTSELQYHIKEQNLPKQILKAAEVRSFHMIMNSLGCYYFHHSNIKNKKEIKNEIEELKNWPYFHQAIWSKNNKYFNFKQIIFKYTLRLPYIWPIKVLYLANNKLKGPLE